MAGKPVGTIFAELDLDKTRYTTAQQSILKDAQVVCLEIEKNYRNLGIKSAASFDLMRAQAENAYQGIAHSANTAKEDIARAEQAKNDKISALNKQQFGEQTSLLNTMKSNWVATAAVIGAAWVAGKGIYNFVAGTIEAKDQLVKLSQEVGVSASTLQLYQYAARAADVDTEKVTTAMGFLAKNMMGAVDGTGKAGGAFRALGISVKDSVGNLLPTDKVMAQISDKFAGMQDGAGKTALAMLMFGRSGKEMIPMLNEGSQHMEVLRREAESLGMTFDESAIKAAARTAEEFKKLKMVFENIAGQLVVTLLPAFDELAKSIGNASKNSNGFQSLKDTFKTLIEGVYTFAAGLDLVGGTMTKIAAIAAKRDPLTGIGGEKEGYWKGLNAEFEARYNASMKASAVMREGQQRMYSGHGADSIQTKDQSAKSPAPIIANDALAGVYSKLAIAQAEFKKKIDELNPALSSQENLIQKLVTEGEILAAKQTSEAAKKHVTIDTSWIDQEVKRGIAYLDAGFPKRMGIKLQFEIDKIGMSDLEKRIADINEQATEMRKKEGPRPDIKAWQDAMVNQATLNDALKLSITINENLYEVEKKRIDIQQQLKSIDIDTTAKGLTDRIEAEKQINQYRLQYAEISPIESINRETEASKALIAIERDRLMDQIALRSVRADSEEAQASAWVANKQALAEIALGDQKVLDLETQRLYKLKDYTKTFAEGKDVGYTQFAIAQGSNYQQGVTYATDIATGAKDTFKNIFFDGMQHQWKTAADYADMFVQHLQNALADLAAKRIMQAIIQPGGVDWLSKGLGIVGGLFGLGGGTLGNSDMTSGISGFAGSKADIATNFHQGGTVGIGGTTRAVYPEIFASAPRLHKGLASDEYPVILQDGETVTPKGGSKGKIGSSTTDASATNNYYYIQAVDAKSFADICKTNPAAVSGPVMQQLRDNKIRTEFKNLLR